MFPRKMTTEFRLVQNLRKAEADLNQFMRLRNQLVTAAENFAREENLSPLLIPTLSKHMDEQLKLAKKVVDVVDRANKDLCDSATVQCGQAREFLCSSPIICKEKEDEKFQQIVYVKYKLEEVIYVTATMSSLYDTIITNQPICKVL